MEEKLSENFTLKELTYSDTAKAKGINNLPTEVHKKVLKHTCQFLLEPLRRLLNDKYKEYKGKRVKNVALKITSGYRSVKLNTAVGGSSTSQHAKGEAVDCEATIVYIDGTRAVLPYTELYENIKMWVRAKRISVDQCIQERSGNAVWVHISHSSWGASKDRKQFLKFNNGTYQIDSVQ